MDLRTKVALCCRLLALEGLIDYSGHVSAREPGAERVYIHPVRLSRLVVSPDDVLVVDLAGNLLEGEGRPPIETPLHTAVYRARSDVFSVAHLHAKWATIYGMTGRPFFPACAHGAIFAEGVPLLDDSRHITTPELGDTMAAALGPCRALLLRGHGSVVAGASVEVVFGTALHLEENAEKLYHASLLGEVPALRPEEIEDTVHGWEQRTVPKIWAFYLSKAAREGILPAPVSVPSAG